MDYHIKEDTPKKRKFWIIKDGTGGKLVVKNTWDGKCHEEKYLTNDELRELYRVLGELAINQDIPKN